MRLRTQSQAEMKTTQMIVETLISLRTSPRAAECTSHLEPKDGSSMTIPSKKCSESRNRGHENGFFGAAHQSQTSLLIAYFEGGKGPKVHSRPSFRLRRIEDIDEHTQVTASNDSCKPSYTRVVSIGPRSSRKGRPQTVHTTRG